MGVTAEHGPDGLLGDERVARRTLPDQGRELGPVGRPVGHQRRQHVAWQGRHVEGRHLAQAAQLGERDVEVGGAARAVGPERDEHQHRLTDEVGDEVGDEIAGRPVGPLQVVDHEEHRAPFGEVDDQLVQQVEEHDGRAGVRAGLRQAREPLPQQSGDVGVGFGARRVADRGQHRPERRGVGDVDRAAGEDHCPVPPGVAGQLLDQPCLADPAVPGDEHRPRTSGAGRAEGAGERGELPRASPEPGDVFLAHTREVNGSSGQATFAGALNGPRGRSSWCSSWRVRRRVGPMLPTGIPVRRATSS